MSPVRKVASWLLCMVLRNTPPNSREWAEAMLRELDYIENDWAALLWAIGSTSAIFRNSLSGLFKGETGGKEKPMPGGTQNRTAGILTGVLMAGLLVVCMFGVVDLLFHLFPKWDLGPMPWWVAVIVIPEITFVVAIVSLWRKRRPMALGILLTAVILATHFAVHIANHFR
jgi:hypothetical protein